MSSRDIDTPEADVSERQPLLGPPRKDSDDLSTITPAASSGANLKIVLPALMVCAFLAAFDVTVVAAIYPIMYSLPNYELTVSAALILKVQIE
jgi:hypothetical protein